MDATGGCLCGALRYRFDRGAVIAASNCHCIDCQRSTGSGMATIVLVPTEALEIEGEPRFYTVVGTAGSHVSRGFCPNCGSPVISGVDEDPAIRFMLKQPFTVRKIFNRIKALLPSENAQLLKVGEIVLEPERHIVTCDGKETHLTPRLSNLLRMLMEQPGVVIPRDELFRRVWHTDDGDNTRALDVHIAYLRRKLEADPRKPRLIVTERGVGYRLRPPD